MKELFLLRDDIVFLNFGSFGACPKQIFEDYMKWQLLLEREPVQFITRDGYEFIENARKSLASTINCGDDELVFVPNPTHAINLVVKSLKLSQNDEILTTNLEYGAIDRTWEYYCEKAGAKYIKQHIQLPIVSKEGFLDDFWKGYNERTKIIFISQITSSTALILPVKEICDEAKRRGLMTIVDGAHVPGHIPLNLNTLQADFYTGACHKWLMTPKGSSFLYANKKVQSLLEPLIISWGYKSLFPSDSTFLDHHQFNGTRDFSAYLTIPAALQFRVENDWENKMELCKSKTLEYADWLFETLKTAPLAPLNRSFFGQMCSAKIRTKEPEKLQRLLFEKYRIEIPVMRHGSDCYIRFSVQAFTKESDLIALVDALNSIKSETSLIE